MKEVDLDAVMLDYHILYINTRALIADATTLLAISDMMHGVMPTLARKKLEARIQTAREALKWSQVIEMDSCEKGCEE